MSDEVRIGIFGAGAWTQTVLLPNLRELPGARVVAVTSNDLEKRRKAREAWGGPLCFYEEPEDLLQDAIDAVVVATPNHTHEALSIAALEAGKHVLCEKPVAFTSEGVDRIAASRERAGTVFQADLELRYSDVLQRMQALIREGLVGEPKLLHCLRMRDWGGFRSWRGDPEQSGGMFLELGIHYLDLFNALAGTAPERVVATGGHGTGGPLPDYLACLVEYDAGIRASLSLSVIASCPNEIRLHVIGSEGRLEGEIIGGTLAFWPRRCEIPEDRSPGRQPDYRFRAFPGTKESLAHWLHCIRTGDAPVADLAAARSATAVCAAAEESLRAGEAVRV